MTEQRAPARRSDGRPTAEEMLDRVRREAGAGARGRLRVYLGIAPGVGKTYKALEELHRRKERGTDVVIGFLETHGRPRTAELAASLETVPRKKIPYKGVTVEEIDTDAVIQRHPAVALVDELAHTNAPARNTRNAGKMSRICSRRASLSSVRSISSTWRVWRTSSRTSLVFRSASACPTRWWTKLTRSS